MINPKSIVQQLLADCTQEPIKSRGEAFAPSNIALCKYWGKRNTALNLPMNSSLSISLGALGATSQIELIDAAQDEIIINDHTLDVDSVHAKRTSDFLDLFRHNPASRYRLNLRVNIPVAAGLASSACIYASIVKSLDAFYGWTLDLRRLSIFARLGSGSACRSLEEGFVEWHQGSSADGLDSFAECLDTTWPALRIGLVIITSEAKKVSSREGMQQTVLTSPLYQRWPEKAEKDLILLKSAIQDKDFKRLGETAEDNARAMHATMLDAKPSLSYSTPETAQIIDHVETLRHAGLPVYFTQDAGPNIKLLFLSDDESDIKAAFPELTIVDPFASTV